MFVLIFILLLLLSSGSQQDCLGVLTSGVDEIIDPPTCLNINSEPGASNHSTVIWFLSNERWLLSPLSPPNITLSYGKNIQSGFPFRTRMIVFRNGSLLVPSGYDSWLDTTNVIVYYEGSICNSSEFTINILTPHAPSSLRVEYPIQSTQQSIAFNIRYGGESFLLCIEANTLGLSSNIESTYWEGRSKVYHKGLTITNCTECSCLVNEVKNKLIGGRERIQTFLVLYKTRPCYAVPNKLLSVLYITNTLLDDSSIYSFSYADINGLPLPNYKPMYNLIIKGYLPIDPFVTVFPSNLTVYSSNQADNITNTVLCNATTRIGDAGLEWTNEEGPVQWCSSLGACYCEGNNSNDYQFIISQQMVPLSRSNQSYVLNTTIALIICSSSPFSYTYRRYYCSIVNGSISDGDSVLVSYSNDTSGSTPGGSPPSTVSPHLTFDTLYILIMCGLLLPILLLLICFAIICIACLRRKARQEEFEGVTNGRMSLYSPIYMKQHSFIIQGDPLEFPRERLHFQRLIGEGQFGQVWKAQAVGIIPDNLSLNIVAVKTVKADADYIDREELLMELEIMKKLEPHPNILNLLGYCTVGGPCYIIMEYAMYGNMRDFLRSLRNRLAFPQSPPALSPPALSPHAIHNEGLSGRCIERLCSCDDTPQLPSLASDDPWSLYANVSTHNTVLKQHLINRDYYNQRMSNSDQEEVIECRTEARHVISSDRHVTSPDCHMTNTPTDPILTEKEIFNFALQISRGMKHLQSLKCIHRDLAARNVLIAEGYFLKIADFGLARELSEKNYYRRHAAGKLPARWMAIESLDKRQTHTHQSDVWSFGIVLWEICTYGETPYKAENVGITLESLLQYIEAGNRLAMPEHCSEDMYELMLKCWDYDPNLRPSFDEIVTLFDGLLSLAHGYLQMATEDDANCTGEGNQSTPTHHENENTTD